jgi:hypothetical protein
VILGRLTDRGFHASGYDVDLLAYESLEAVAAARAVRQLDTMPVRTEALPPTKASLSIPVLLVTATAFLLVWLGDVLAGIVGNALAVAMPPGLAIIALVGGLSLLALAFGTAISRHRGAGR